MIPTDPGTDAALTEDMRRQRALEQALSNYCKFPHNQGFAILLNGTWGSGKTRFIKDFIEKNPQQRPGETPQPALYVSLYGVSNSSDIDDLLFQKLHPLLSHKATRLAGALLKGLSKLTIKLDLDEVGQITGTTGETNISSMLRGADGRTIIFDDFERALMPPAAILGYINPLVEHDNCKVIIVADENNISANYFDDYWKRKEKTIGRTFVFEPAVRDAYNSFLKEIDDATVRDYLRENELVVIRVFNDSKLNNLRILKQFLWDFEQLRKSIEPRFLSNKIAMQEILALLCSVALELRSGRLKEEDFDLINGFTLSIIRRVKDEPAHPMEAVTKRYPNIRFDTTLLTRDIICDCVLRSRVVPETLNATLSLHSYFARSDNEPPSWRAMWLSFEAPPDQQQAALQRFEADFTARKFCRQGEIYHVIGLGLWLSELGYVNWPALEVKAKLINYIDDVFSTNQPSEEEAVDADTEDLGLGFGGFTFRQSDTTLFGELRDYARIRRTEWRKQAYPRISSRLLELLRSDSQEFLRLVCFTNTGPSTYASAGILKFIDADAFAQAVIGASHHDQKEILMALSIRYEQMGGYAELKDELPWLKEVVTKLHEKKITLSPISSEALSRLIDHYVEPHTKPRI